MATAILPDHSRDELYLSEEAPAIAGADYFDIHESDLETVAEADDEELLGYIHSAQLGSTVDGPGLRFVVFLTGCLLRCQYCHNPDTWHKKNGKPFSVAHAMRVLEKYVEPLKISKGGITLSGGEPLVQLEFTTRIFRRCKALGLHTCLDTSGRLGDRLSDEQLMDIDLNLLDIKSGDPEIYKHVTHAPLQPTLDYARRLSDLGRPMWVRYVLVPGQALGIFAGSGTSTSSLQAAIQALGNDDPAVGYSVAYPFGVFGPILLLYLAFMILKPRFATAGAGQEILEISIRNPEVIGKSIGEVTKTLPAGVQITAVREDHHNEPASPETILREDDVVLAVSADKQVLEQACEHLGELAAGRIANDRRDLDYLRVFASAPSVIGKPLNALALPGGIQYSVMSVRRGDSDLLGQPNLMLEYGDRIALLASRANFPAVRKFFGDSIKGTSEFSYISIGLGMALGFLVGAIKIPVPGFGKIAIGLAGVLVAALVLGKLRRTGSISWTIPLSANLVLRNLGLTLFLAQVGMASGPKSVATVAQTGFLFLGLSAIVLIALVLPVLLIGLYVFKLPYDQVAGIVAGATGNPAILAFSNKLAPTDRPDIGYAMIFPGMTIVKILFVYIVPGFFR